jgi:hypothetical protein
MILPSSLMIALTEHATRSMESSFSMTSTYGKLSPSKDRRALMRRGHTITGYMSIDHSSAFFGVIVDIKSRHPFRIRLIPFFLSIANSNDRRESSRNSGNEEWMKGFRNL